MRLTVASGPDRGATFPLADKLTVGRNPECDVVLKDLQVSRRHAYLKALPNGTVELHDLGSGNGTYVDGSRVQSAVLSGSESIRFGDTVMELSLDRGPAAGAAAAAAGDPTYRERFGPERPQAAPPPIGSSAVPSKSSIQRVLLERSVRRATILAAAACILVVGIAILFATGAIPLGGGGTDSDRLTTAEIVEEVTPSTVLVVNDEGGVVGRGTGWVLDAEKGLIVTNAHVTATPRGEGNYSVGTDARIDLLPSRRGIIAGTDARRAQLVGQALCEDMAILEVDDTSGLRTLPLLGEQSELRVGDPVIAIGYPATKNLSGFTRADLTGNTGVVSVPRTTFRAAQAGPGIVAGPYRNVILTDTVINEGNSGGPLVNEEGELVGMNTAGNDSVQGQNYAIGVNRLRELLPRIEDGADVCD